MDDSEMWISGEKKDVEDMKSDRGLKCDKVRNGGRKKMGWNFHQTVNDSHKN
jgi:hypothetical protein